MSEEISIRPAAAADSAAIFEVTRRSAEELCRGHYRPEQLRTWMGDRTPETYREGAESGRIQVAELQGRIVGYVDAVPGEITRLFILPEAAGRGLGARLMRLGLALARRGHAGPIHIEATRNAAPFYERFGFVRVGEGVFQGRGTDYPPIEVVLMQEAAPPGPDTPDETR